MIASRVFSSLPNSHHRLSFWWFSLLFTVAIAAEETLITRIAFGSCANQSAPQPIWDAINKFDPQLFIWLGDNIYGDIRRPLRVIGKERTFGPWKNTPRFVPSSEEEMKLRYAKAKANPGYSHLQRKVKVIGTWDDHDYGLNDAGKEFDRKVINQKLMLDFLDEPLDSPRRKQAGVYASYTYGPPNRKVKVIVLDTRYHRDPLRSDGSILGDTQWDWLEQELRGPRSEITIIGSSVQVISNLSATTGPLFYMESWGRFPKERKRLFKLISDTKRNGVIFISGDVHFGEITRYDCSVGYPLYDVTSSGLVQSVEKVFPRPLHSIVRLLFWYTPSTMRVINDNCKFKSCTYGQQNFGAISIDWNANPVIIRLEIRDVNGHTVLGTNVSLSELQPGGSNSLKDATTKGKSQRYCTLEIELPGLIRYRLAVLIYFTIAVLAMAILGLIIGGVLAITACVYKCKVD
ncbi:Alkaline phosphatase D-related [Arabidopsis thaliana x Arabidopsis arenosa]|uniref:Alkaline phosphatase D-related n=1 Tax=Arabidopsis thaliana x Arabidopsis arenosa TaxID=1240361 RepID=A0A8T1XKI6_9BRAS|nr:Alkaline phosphatase D-related [Arabidopsis thaliana x Arabidopsis arenosa]